MSGRMIGQKRAEDALSCARALVRHGINLGKYRAYVDRLGPAIVMNGLGQALATERAAAGSKSERKPDQEAHWRLYSSLQRWLCGEGGVYGGGDLLTAIIKGDQQLYVRAQAEALAWLEWHKKFCRALLPKTEGGE